MSTNKILIGGLIGFVVTFILGFLIYGMLLTDFFATNAGSATGVSRAEDAMLFLPLALGHLALGMLLAIILGRWAGIKTFTSGAMAGAVIGFLTGSAYDLIMYGTTNMMNLTGTLVDIVITTISTAIAAGIIGWYYGYSNKN